MNTFKDNTGREWQLTLNLGTAMDVKERLGIDLLQPESPRPRNDPRKDESDADGDTPVITLLGTDEMLLAETLAVMLAGQFETHGVTEGEVRRAFDGPRRSPNSRP